ncbi:hypothetical protein L0939_20290, partial [Paracidovorax citrulli]
MQDLVRCLGPDEWLWRGVVHCDVRPDRILQRTCGAKAPALDLPGSEDREPALDLVVITATTCSSEMVRGA